MATEIVVDWLEIEVDQETSDEKEIKVSWRLTDSVIPCMDITSRDEEGKEARLTYFNTLRALQEAKRAGVSVFYNFDETVLEDEDGIPPTSGVLSVQLQGDKDAATKLFSLTAITVYHIPPLEVFLADAPTSTYNLFVDALVHRLERDADRLLTVSNGTVGLIRGLATSAHEMLAGVKRVKAKEDLAVRACLPILQAYYKELRNGKKIDIGEWKLMLSNAAYARANYSALEEGKMTEKFLTMLDKARKSFTNRPDVPNTKGKAPAKWTDLELEEIRGSTIFLQWLVSRHKAEFALEAVKEEDVFSGFDAFLEAQNKPKVKAKAEPATTPHTTHAVASGLPQVA